MSQAPDDQAFPRQPLQQRSKDRFERVVDAARELLLEKGLSGFSIPELAARLQYSRATIYNFFPTPYAIFNELTRRYLAQYEEILHNEARRLVHESWQDGARALARVSARFYNRQPAACVLLLGGPITDESYRAQELMIQRLGHLLQRIFAARGVTLPPGPPDVSLLTVEIASTCFRVSYLLHGRVTAEYQAEAGEAMIAYLSRYVPNNVAATSA
jgi:AcrR family transcriptional regulator